jgi:ketosteroid isomerase-like protein
MSQENVEIVRRWWEGFNEDGMPPLALCDEEIEIHMPPDFPVRGVYRRHDGVRQWREEVFEIIDDPRVEAEDVVDVHGDGEAVLMMLRTTGTTNYAGIEVDYEWAAIWTIRGGKVVRAQGYLNRDEARDAAGLPQ